MGNDAWLKLHTSLLTSSKFCKLPTNEHRWAFICLLLLAKKGLEGAPDGLTLGHLFMNKRRWKVVRADLIDAGLLDADGSVNGFEDSQLSFEAVRMRRYRENKKGVTDSVTGNVTRYGKNVTDAEAEAYQKKTPPTPRTRGASARPRPSADDRAPEQGAERQTVASVLASLAGGADPGCDPVPVGGARSLAEAFAAQRHKLDPVPIAAPVVDQWALSIARLHHHSGRPWQEIGEVIGWLFADPWWSPRVITVHDLCKNYARIRAQWQASLVQPPPAADAAAPRITGAMVGNLDMLIADGEDPEPWIQQQPAALRAKLRTIAKKAVSRGTTEEDIEAHRVSDAAAD